MKFKVDQCVQVFTGSEINRASMAAVTAVWTTPRDELLSAEAETSVATVTRCDLDADVVDEHTGLSLLVLNLPNPRDSFS